MPRSNIPFRSMRPFTTRKRSSFTRSHFRNNSDTQSSENQQGQVNNILVFPKYSETTINVVSDNSRIYPYGNLLKKIKGRKRKDKQRMKKKQNAEGDVKPIVKKVTPAKMNPRLNKHIIFLSDSEGEIEDENIPENTLIVNEIPVKDKIGEDDDDVIFVETPAPEIIEIEDTAEVSESPQKVTETSERTSSPDDFLDNAHVNLKSKFDFEPEGIAFAKPTSAPVDMSESGSISSVSDISATIGMNVFKLIDFPQEKVNLFDDDNLEKFRDAITPKRTNKKSNEDVESQNDKLPTLSDIQAETPKRHERGRSIIKELVNDRAYVLLSQKKSKNKKRKSKDDGDAENVDDSSESNKKKKKKKAKKKESNEPEDDTITNDATDSCPEVSFSSKKIKKNKQKDSEVVEEDNLENKKKKYKKNEELSRIVPDTVEEDIEKKKKKNRKNSEENSEFNIQENTEEKKKKKAKKNLEETQPESQQIPEENEERKRKKIKEHQPQHTIPEENEERKRKKFKENQQELQQTVSEENEERKKKKNKEHQLDHETVLEQNEERKRKKIKKNVDDKEGEQEYSEEKKKKRNRRTSAPSDLENIDEREKEYEDTEVQQNEEKRKKKNKKTEILNMEMKEVTTQKDDTVIEGIEVKLENVDEEKQEETPEEQTIIEHSEIEKIQEIRLNNSTKDTGNDNQQVIEKEETISNEKTCEMVEIGTDELWKTANEEICREVVTEIKIEEVQNLDLGDNKEDRADVSTECQRKRKQDISVSESLNNSKDNKRIKLNEENIIVVESPQMEIDNNTIDDELKVERNEEEDTETMNVETTGCDYSLQNQSVPLDVSQIPMMVIDNEGNVDMKLTSVTSIFPNENNFSKDVIVDNFMEKNNSWNADPARFCSYNASLFNEMKQEESSIIVAEDPKIESTISEPKNDESVVETVENSNEIIEVKQEKEIVTIEDGEHISCLDQIVVKVEVEEARENEPRGGELPNDIEEIVKEKDNLHTVKKLCEFLEEVNDPNDVLKKVSLLKKAFTGKSPDTCRSIESVEITHDNDDVLSISSSGSSVICCEDDVSILCIDDDITLANCDITEPQENNPKTNEQIEQLLDDLNKTEDVVIVDSTPKRSDAVEVIREAFKRNDKFQPAQSTPKSKTDDTSRFVSGSGGDSSPILRNRGLDKFEVNEVQDLMSDNPRLWRIVPEDIHPIKLPNKGKRCIKCRELGHLGYNCPNRLKLPKCSLCGNEGHLDFKCPHKICIQCGRKAPMIQNCCDHCKHFRNLTCAMCKNKGHPKNKCPDMWRRYHLTVNHGPLVHGEVLKLKSKEHLWCSSCARSGHIDIECEATWRKFKYSQPLDPRIHFYDDIYKVPHLTNNQEFVQPNLDEVPQTSTNFLRDTDNSSTSSSSSSAVDTRERNECPPTNDTLETVDQSNQTNQSIGEGLQGLPPDFEVIDEVTDERQESVPETTEMNHLFMTAPVDSIRQFLRQELSVLETGKFEIKNIHPRFFAFVEDDKFPEHKQRFSRRKKEAFYKSLNMLLFGKLQVKCGKVHTDKLKNFVNLSTCVLDQKTRESLCYSYDYLFRNSPHDHVNYKFFLKMIRNKYGNKRWIF